MKNTIKFIFVMLSAAFIVSGCSNDSSTDTAAEISPDTLTVKSVELK